MNDKRIKFVIQLSAGRNFVLALGGTQFGGSLFLDVVSFCTNFQFSCSAVRQRLHKFPNLLKVHGQRFRCADNCVKLLCGGRTNAMPKLLITFRILIFHWISFGARHTSAAPCGFTSTCRIETSRQSIIYRFNAVIMALWRAIVCVCVCV